MRKAEAYVVELTLAGCTLLSYDPDDGPRRWSVDIPAGLALRVDDAVRIEIGEDESARVVAKIKSEGDSHGSVG